MVLAPLDSILMFAVRLDIVDDIFNLVLSPCVKTDTDKTQDHGQGIEQTEAGKESTFSVLYDHHGGVAVYGLVNPC